MSQKRPSLMGRAAALVCVLIAVVAYAAIAGAAPRCNKSRFQSQAGNVYDATTGLTWEAVVDAGTYNWSDAKSYCAGLGAGWRLPSLNELQTIVDDTRASPAIDPTAFPNTPATLFWTSSPHVGTAAQVWSVDFTIGTTRSNSAAPDFLRLRCVR